MSSAIPTTSATGANGTLVGTPSSGYPSDFTIPTASGLEWALFPSAANGSQTTYVPDYWDFVGSYPCLCHGGYYIQNQDRGPFCVYWRQSVGLERRHRLSPPGTTAKGGVTVPLKR